MKSILKQLTITITLLTPLFINSQEARIMIRGTEDITPSIQAINRDLPQNLAISVNNQTILDEHQKSVIIGAILNGITPEAKQKIRQLFLPNNQLQYLPTHSILGLNNLFILDLSNNQLQPTNVPIELYHIPFVSFFNNQTWKNSGNPEHTLFIKPTMQDALAGARNPARDSQFIKFIVAPINKQKPSSLSIKIDPNIPFDIQSLIVKNLFFFLTDDAKKGIAALYLAGNKLVDLPNLEAFTNLQILIAHDNKLITAPDLTKNKQLGLLDLSNNDLSEFPNVDGLENLSIIELSGNDDLSENSLIESILFVTPRWENEFHSLITNNRIQEAQNFASALLAHGININLPKRIKIQFNSITSPEDNRRAIILDLLLNAMTNEAKNTITVLDFSESNLKQPPNLAGFPNLTLLDLSNNKLETSPNLTGLSNLTALDLSNNQISQPPQLNNLLNLEVLNLENNPLQATMFIPFYLQNIQIIGVDPDHIIYEQTIQNINQLRNFLANNSTIIAAYPEAITRNQFINSFIEGDAGDLLAAGHPIGGSSVLEQINQMLQETQEEQQARRSLPAATERIFLDIATSHNQEPKFLTSYSFDRLQQKLERDLQELRQRLERGGAPETLIATTLEQHGLNPETIKLNKIDERTPILLFNKPPRTLIESWHHWNAQGITLNQFLELLKSGDTMTSQNFTIPRSVAVDFLRDIRLNEQESNQLLDPHTKQGFVEFSEPLIDQLQKLLADKGMVQIIEPTASPIEPEQQEPDIEQPTKRRRME